VTEALVLHEYSQSGNCYKIRLTAALLGLPLERREYDILQGETRTAAFLADVNPNGRIPVLQIDDRFIPESNAACFYLAEGSPLVPDDRFDCSDMLRWMFFEQYNHEPNVATMRFWMAFLGEEKLSEVQRASLPARREGGNAALKLMDDHLSTHAFFVAERLTLADIALYAYTHVAEEGGFDLSLYPAVGAWLARVADTRGYLPMSN